MRLYEKTVTTDYKIAAADTWELITRAKPDNFGMTPLVKTIETGIINNGDPGNTSAVQTNFYITDIDGIAPVATSVGTVRDRMGGFSFTCKKGKLIYAKSNVKSSIVTVTDIYSFTK